MNADSASRSFAIKRTVCAVVPALVLCAASQARAQVLPVSLSYNLSVPLVKTVPNPCTGAFVLLNGSLDIGIATTQGGTVPFVLGVNLNSSGTGQDALADGTLVLSSTSGNYIYASGTSTEAGFPAKPTTFSQTVQITDLVYRQYQTTDSFVINTALQLVFSNGVPSGATIESLNISCQ